MQSRGRLGSLVANGLIGVGVSPAFAADVDLRHGVDLAQTLEERRLCFDCDPPSEHGSLLPLEPCHPHRFPHGSDGRAWISVGPGLHKRWKREVLACRGVEGEPMLRERLAFPSSGERLQFTELPEGAGCSARLRGGEPATTLVVRPGEVE